MSQPIPISRSIPTPLVQPIERAEHRFDFEQLRQILPQLVDALTDAVLVVDREQRVVAANRRYLETFGGAEMVAGSSCHHGVNCPMSGGNREPGACVACDVFVARNPRKVLQAIPDATGVLRRWEATLNPVVDGAGTVTHVVEIWRDITDRSQLEGQLSHSERLASLGMLAAGVAHEINNPLASILAGVETLQRWLARAGGLDAGHREEAREVLELLERETQRSRETTDKLLLLAQPYSGASVWVDVNRAARETLTLLGFQMRKQEIEVVEELDPELPQLWARESGIRGIWMNLIMNAVQAMPSGGVLTVRTAARGDTITFEITDTGPGIAPVHLDRIWDPFFTTKPPGVGTGLGLSITQRIVTRNNGEIRAENVPGGGARFVVTLPRSGSGGPRV